MTPKLKPSKSSAKRMPTVKELRLEIYLYFDGILVEENVYLREIMFINLKELVDRYLSAKAKK